MFGVSIISKTLLLITKCHIGVTKVSIVIRTGFHSDEVDEDDEQRLFTDMDLRLLEYLRYNHLWNHLWTILPPVKPAESNTTICKPSARSETICEQYNYL